MVSKTKSIDLATSIASLLIVMRRSLRLIFTPYKTMRKISMETDYLQLLWIGFFVLSYFVVVGVSKLLTFLTLSLITIALMYGASFAWRKAVKLSSVLFTFGYGLLPTVLWFYMSFGLYYLLPPPRTQSLQGKIFSVLYVSFSLSLLLWKLILTYLAIRFSLKLGFYSTMFTLICYIICILTISYFGYTLGLSKVPFI